MKYSKPLLPCIYNFKKSIDLLTVSVWMVFWVSMENHVALFLALPVLNRAVTVMPGLCRDKLLLTYRPSRLWQRPLLQLSPPSHHPGLCLHPLRWRILQEPRCHCHVRLCGHSFKHLCHRGTLVGCEPFGGRDGRDLGDNLSPKPGVLITDICGRPGT